MADVLPVTDPDRRFPQPERQSDILMTSPRGTLTRGHIFAYLTDPGSEHWRHQLDWKQYTRLLAVKDWVFKTNGWYCSEDVGLVQRRIAQWKKRSRKLAVWHPDRYWFIVRQRKQYWPCNVTPRLLTLLDIEQHEAHAPKLRRLELDARRYLMFLRILVTCGLLLDVKKANFAVQPGNRRLYYIDDELYGFNSLHDLLHLRSRLRS